MTRMTYLEAGRAAVADALRRDPSVWCLGEDLGRGGVFGQYKGLAEEFGVARVADAPISEAAIMGAALGAALVGTRPVVEMRFADFALCAVDELVNQAAKARFMFGGQARAPMTVRMPMGMWRSSAAQHSQSLEAWYAHVPGLAVACPATPDDAHGLLASAIAADDPVVVMEHKNLWPLEGEVTGDPIPFGVARLARPGRDVTVVSWSATVHAAVAAAEILAAEGVEAEVIDLRTIWPWDREAVLDSVRRTRRLVVAHEAVETGGFGGEIVATVAEHAHADLLSAPRRVGAPRAPIAYAPGLEDRLRVTPERIAAAVRAALAPTPA